MIINPLLEGNIAHVWRTLLANSSAVNSALEEPKYLNFKASTFKLKS